MKSLIRLASRPIDTIKTALPGCAIFLLLGAFPVAAQGPSLESIVQAAKKEGKVVHYGTSGSKEAFDKAQSLFRKKYGLKVEILYMRSREVRERVNTERRAKRYIADVAFAGATSLPALWEDGGLENWLPPSIKTVRDEVAEVMELPKVPISPIHVNLRGILVNTAAVPAGREPKAWRDLGDPFWQGKILMDDPRSAGAGQSWFQSTLRVPELGEAFHEALAKNKPLFVGTGTYQQIEAAITAGQFPLGFPVDVDAIKTLKGAKVKWVAPREGVTYTVMGIGLVKNATRTNAAKLWIDFLLSEEMQRIFGEDHAPVRKGAPSTQPEWSLDHVRMLPRPTVESAAERNKSFRLAEKIYGVR
ncbi:MAG: extracellular solute-binding protein [Deltaproteobacteria bacterium]|nr:extracellular solute-binding protein [Deltaproteobacteria bacterium]